MLQKLSPEEKGNHKHIFFVDDDLMLLQVVKETLRNVCPRVSCFSDAACCLEQLAVQKCDLLITDFKMPEINGLELLSRAKQMAPHLPVMIVTAYGDVPTAVQAINSGAADFIEKPLDREHFLQKVRSLLEMTSQPAAVNLNCMERRVLELVNQGKNSREIADILKRSPRTIEWHRSNIMSRLGVDNVVDMIKEAIKQGLIVYHSNDYQHG